MWIFSLEKKIDPVVFILKLRRIYTESHVVMFMISSTVTPLYTALRSLRNGHLLKSSIIMFNVYILSISCGDKNKLCEIGGSGGSHYAVFFVF
jgi:hypothetical protein